MHKMKDSGIEWIGEIPENINVLRNKYLIKYVKGRLPSEINSEGEGIPYVGASDLEDLSGNCAYASHTTDVTLPLCEKEDVLILWDGARAGLIGTNHQGVISSTIVNAMPYEGIFKKFWYWYLKAFQSHLYKCVNGTTIPHMNTDYIEDIAMLDWSKEEQIRIADYLDKKCAEIDALIAAKERTNALLRERRQSIIYEAVTKGLDPTVPMKDSGIEWIGEIPESWITTRIKYTSTLKGRIGWQGLKSDEYIDEGPYLITGTDFVSGVIDWKNCAHISNERFEEAPEIHIFEGDLLITKDGTIGKLAIAENCPDEVSLNSGVLLIRNKERGEYLNKYLYYILQSDVFWKWFRLSQNGNSTIIHLYQEQFSNFRYSLPSINEQKDIVDYLDTACMELDSLINANQSTIEKLKEYRQSVIYEAVTGKVEI